MGLGWSAYQTLQRPRRRCPVLFRPERSLSQAKDFSALLADWNGSPQKQAWLRSSNYEVFSRSRLLLRLKDAGKQFAAAAGLPPDMNFMSQVAGSESALALYDIGKLQFVYITRLPSANAMQNQLWQTRVEVRDPQRGRHDVLSAARSGITAGSRVRGQRELSAARHPRRFDGRRALQLLAGGERKHH